MRWIKRTWSLVGIAVAASVGGHALPGDPGQVVVGLGWLLMAAALCGIAAGVFREVWGRRDQWAGGGQDGG